VARNCPSCNVQVGAGKVICINCGFNLVEGAKIQTLIAGGSDEETDGPAPAPIRPRDPKRSSPVSSKGEISRDRMSNAQRRAQLQDDLRAEIDAKHQFQEKKLPLILIAAGVVLVLFNCFVLAPKAANSFFYSSNASNFEIAVEALIGSLILLALQIPCLFAGIILISKLFGAAFGTLTSAIKKLLALALLAGAFHTGLGLGLDILLSGFGGIAWMLKASVSFTFFWIIIKLLFDELEIIEVLLLFVAMLIMPSVVIISLFILFAGM
jgi:hypothetical protein